MNKKIAALLITSAAAVIAVGCGNTAQQSAGNGGAQGGSGAGTEILQNGDGGKSQTVSWWTWSTEATDAFAKQIAYAEEHDPSLNVDIQYTANADFMAKLPVAIAGGTGPDIYQMTRPSFELYAASGQAMDLTEAIAKTPKLQEYLNALSPEVREAYQFEGKQMAIPFTVESTAIAYNKDLFKKAGLPEPKDIEDTWTWDDLHEMAKKLTIKNEKGETTQYGIFAGTDRLPAWELIWSNGGELFSEDRNTATLDDPRVAEGLKPLVEMYQEGLSPSVDTATQTSGDDIFISGQIAMIPAGIWKLPSYSQITGFEWDVAELPKDSSTGKRVSSSNILGLFVNPNAKNKEGAIALLEQLVQPECQKILADTHTYIPALESVREGYFEGDVPENIIAYKNALNYIHPNTLTQYIPYGQFNQEVSDAIKRAYKGEVTIEQSMKELSNHMNVSF